MRSVGMINSPRIPLFHSICIKSGLTCKEVVMLHSAPPVGPERGPDLLADVIKKWDRGTSKSRDYH